MKKIINLLEKKLNIKGQRQTQSLNSIEASENTQGRRGFDDYEGPHWADIRDPNGNFFD